MVRINFGMITSYQGAQTPCSQAFPLSRSLSPRSIGRCLPPDRRGARSAASHNLSPPYLRPPRTGCGTPRIRIEAHTLSH